MSPADDYTFRLDNDSSGSYSDSSSTDRSSVYKHRIDSLFARQNNQSANYRAAKPVKSSYYESMATPDVRTQNFQHARSAVQAQIEKMITADAQKVRVIDRPLPKLPTQHGHKPELHGQPSSVEQRAQKQVDESMSRIADMNKSDETLSNASGPTQFKVDYLGAIAVEDKATQLEDLQIPLKKLYMEYQIMLKRKRPPLPGNFEIGESGVRVQYVRELHKGTQEVFNPFPTIAVWAAVKFVAKKVINHRGQMELKFAFLPIICDPEGQEKFTLYNDLEIDLITEAIGVNHPPVFACVMRKPGLVKTLECHGFVCSSSEDAIVMAANLYQSLLSSMKSREMNSSSSPSFTRTKSSDSNSELNMSRKPEPRRPPRRRKAPPPPPTDRSRPSFPTHSHIPDERRKVQRRRSSVRRQNGSQSRDGTALGENVKTQNVSRSASVRRSRRLTRSASDHRRESIRVDNMTAKTTLPRSSSIQAINQRTDMREFLLHLQKRDGIRTVDDVLKRVVHPQGMSFNDLKPEHRELLLRLALTLSKDEMYQRSKNIMKKQSKKLTSTGESDTDASAISNVLKATKRSFSRFSSKPKLLPKSKKQSEAEHTKAQKVNRIEEALHKQGFGEVHNTHIKRCGITESMKRPPATRYARDNLPNSNSRSINAVVDGACDMCDCCCDSESVYSSKCYCSLSRNSKSVYNDTCDCDTESCAESEKCYCSLKKVTKNGMKMYEIKLDSESDTTDTTMRTVSSRKSASNRQYGSLSNLSRLDSPSTAWRKNDSTMRSCLGRGKSSSSLLSTSNGVMKDKSLSTVYGDRRVAVDRRTHGSNLSLHSDQKDARLRSDPTKSVSIDNLHHSANGFIFNRLNAASCSSTRSNHSVGSGRFMLVSAADPSGKIVFSGGSQNGAVSGRRGRIADDAMSLKKTTEIAATFSGLKLNQTTDLLNESEDDAYGSMQNNSNNTTPSSHVYSGQNIENSLGYLP